MKKKILINLIILIGFSSIVCAQSVVNNAHNLSVNGSGSVKATSEDEICLFCHTSHNSNPISPLWNRKDPGSTYTLYSSSTLQALPGQPDGSSILCLSCHDGTTALGSVLSRPNTIEFASTTNMKAGKNNLSTDLRDDHPISFTYSPSLASSDGQLKNPSNITAPVKLENSKVQCTSCHDPHKNVNSNFLVTTSQYSNLCNSCHQKPNWVASSHSTSNKIWNGTFPNPWFHTQWNNVAENACENCHNPHNSGGIPRLMKYQSDESNCFDCHNGNVAAKNIQTQFLKTYKHDVYSSNVHDPAEADIPNLKHVECGDCHNPHATNATKAKAPYVNGYNAGVKGINQSGNSVNPAQYEYEICYRCHSQSAFTSSSITRQITQNNVRLEFDLSNPSYHPVAGAGKNLNVPSLIAPYTNSSMIYCTDCHASDGAGSPAGPHGSNYAQILKNQYTRIDNTPYSVSNYALCFECHSSNSIMNDESFSKHNLHVNSAKTPCSICHDAHGVSSTQGNEINNSHLINFNTAVVTNSSSGFKKFEDLPGMHGSCYLTCHGKNHNPLSY